MNDSRNDYRFELSNDQVGVIGRYSTKNEALGPAVPGDSLYDREAERGDVELWLVTGDMAMKRLSAIRRKR